MLKIIGFFPKSLVADGVFSSKHFNASGDFLNASGDFAIKSTNPPVIPMSEFPRCPQPILPLLDDVAKEPPRAVDMSRHQGLVRHFADVIANCAVPDPSDRVTPDLVLGHAFFQ